MRGNEIILELAKGRVTETGNLYQYDYGQRLKLTGVALPAAYEVHFSNQQNGISKTRIGDSTGVDIPDEYLLTGGNIHVWIYLHDGEDDGETEFHGIINVTRRAKPTDQEPTPVQQSVIDQAIAALNAGVAEAEGIAEAIPQTVNTALSEAKASGEFDGFSPSASVSKSGDTATISITDKDGTTTATVKDGEKGDTGEAGYSPSAAVSKSGGTATITITDKSGTTTAQVTDGQDGQDGETGATPVISIGTVSTLTPGSDATVSIDTTDPEHPVLSMGIPEGEPGNATIDDTSTANNRVWSAKKTNELKSAFEAEIIEIPWSPNLVKGEYIKGADGTFASSSGFARTNALWNGYRYKIAVDLKNPSYEYYISYYDETGALDGTGYLGYSEFYSGIGIIPKKAKLFGLSIRRTDRAALSIADMTAIESALTSYSATDESMTADGMPAEAKAVGDIEINGTVVSLAGVSLTKGSFLALSSGSISLSNRYVRTDVIYGYPYRCCFKLHNPAYEMCMLYYDSTGGSTGQGYLNKYSQYISGNPSILWVPGIAVRCGINFRRVDGADMTDGDITAIQSELYKCEYTDRSLSMVGKAADAKAVSDAIGRVASTFYTANDDISLVDTYDGVIALYDSLVEQYPNYVTKNTLTSNSLTNYEYVLTIENYNSQDGHRGQDAEIVKPTILICSGVHGYERSSVMSLYGFVRSMCENNFSLNEIIDSAIYRIIPVVCPWGYTNDSRINENSVNINRNFNTSDWTETDPGQNYSGSAPGNQDETIIVQNWINQHTDALFYIDWHNSSYTNEISCFLGLNTSEAVKAKKKYLTGMNLVIPWWQKEREIPTSAIYAYTGAPTEGYSNTGTSVTYAREAGIELAYTVETSWNVKSTGKHSNFTIGTGEEAFANLMLSLKSYMKDI